MFESHGQYKILSNVHYVVHVTMRLDAFFVKAACPDNVLYVTFLNDFLAHTKELHNSTCYRVALVSC
jgi:hypothetical protein